MDKQIHVYDLDMADLMRELADQLGTRGYEIQRCPHSDRWRIKTRWRRGAAYGEIGSLMYALLSNRLREVEPQGGDPVDPSF